jgi:serine/threonine protein kinase
MHALEPSDPRVIGPYRLLGRLGAGGMGQVFLGLSTGGRPVAVKVVRAELAADPEFRARFGREIAAARKVSGLYTAAVVDADTDGSVPWLATVYVAGPSLAQAVTDHGPLPAGSVLALAAGLAESLAAIHAAGVVHRDLKPSNVLLAEDGPRVIDFGISRAAEVTSMTRTGFVMGSPGYMSPEQAEGGDVGPPSDIFSLGAVLAFAGTGEGPFGVGSTAAVVYRVVHSPANLDRVPDEVRPLVERCLAKDPADRPTAAALLSDVGAGQLDTGWLPASLSTLLGEYASPGLPAVTALTGLPEAPAPDYPPTGDVPEGAARWPTATSRGGTASPPAPPVQPGDAGGRPPRRQRRRLAWVAAAVAVLAAAAAIAATTLTGHPRSEETALSSHVRSTATTSPPAAPEVSNSAVVSPSVTTTRPASPRTAVSTSRSPTAGTPAGQVQTSSSPRPPSPAASYAQAVIANAPVAYWQFGAAPGPAGYADSSGNRDTLPTGLTTRTAPGTPELAGAISTANGGTSTTTSLSPLVGDASRTVEAWFRTTANGCLFSAGQDAHARAFSLCLRDGPVNVPTPGAPGFYFETYDGDVFVPIANLTNGTWHYLAVTLTGNEVDIVIDGTEPQGYIWNGNPSMPGGGAYSGFTAQPFTLPYTPDTSATQLGVATAGLGGIGGGLIGTIAEIAVYPRALPLSELVRHYQLVAG